MDVYFLSPESQKGNPGEHRHFLQGTQLFRRNVALVLAEN